MLARTFFVFAVLTVSAIAQPFGAGFKAGLPLNDAFDIRGTSTLANVKMKRYIFGPQFEVRFPAGVSVELDALYTNFRIDTPLNTVTSVLGSSFDADSWEFPLLLKKKFGGADAVAASVKPFVGAGASFRRLSDVDDIGRFLLGRSLSDTTDRTAVGFVIGAGVEIRALFLRISPEVRFTRWGTENFRAGVADILKTNRNQGQLLVGFSF